MSDNPIDTMQDIYRRGDEAALGRSGFINGGPPTKRGIDLDTLAVEIEALKRQIASAFEQLRMMREARDAMAATLDAIHRTRTK